MNGHSFPLYTTRRRDVKKLILATLTVAALTVFAYSQNLDRGTCTRTTCDGPKRVAAGTCPYTGCAEPVDVKACTPEDCPKAVATCSYTTCENPKNVATTCNGSDASCSNPKITAHIIIHCSQTDSFGGCVDSAFLPTEPGEVSNPRLPT